MGWETEIGVKHQIGRERQNCVYLGGNISENGRVDLMVRRRIQA